ncbi:hypothetical protein OH146_02220 [Salinibacterium sp. SYSU T00001]|uniref:hypothetical protein n=1 Tax=Homoserinimonas sedimenticola TaxID=2986805 RepID=UPI002236A0A2|nr:hypothetical protein [Salinibacterium sedimenticola]MCW4384584.1 hypothetical protein [Salinibacterium sedimenticola]
MRTLGTRGGTLFAVLGAALVLTACGADPADPGDIMDITESDATGSEVIGQGTVIEKPGSTVQICLGPITMIYPPDCGGPEIVGWDWDEVDGEETANGTTWGTYAVQGTWDGEQLTLTEPPIMLALYDPMVPDDPYTDPENPGEASEAELAEIQAELADEPDILGAYPQNGYLFVEVVHDDGSLQEEFNERYGEDVVVVRPQLKPVE